MKSMSEEERTAETPVGKKPSFARRFYDFCTKTKKRKVASALILLSGFPGTFRGVEGGLPPFYNVKTGVSYGTNFGLVSRYKEGARHNGIDVSLVRLCDGGELNGVGLGVLNVVSEEKGMRSKLNGLEIGLGNVGYSVLNSRLIVDGFQIGVININGGGTNGQVGVFNSFMREDASPSFGIGAMFNFEKRGGSGRE